MLWRPGTFHRARKDVRYTQPMHLIPQSMLGRMGGNERYWGRGNAARLILRRF